MPRLNYDVIAERYDEPGRDHAVDPHLLAFLEARRDTSPSTVRILDVGCGTGKQLAANRGSFREMTLVGVDRFQGMLRIARRRCKDVAWVQGDGACLPLASRTFDYVTNQFSYPHIQHPEAFIGEVFRTLKQGGRFAMTHIDPWTMTGWFVYRYFPEAFDLDRQDFVPVDRFVAMMQDAGFLEVQVTSEDESGDESLAAFLRHTSDRHRMSQLMAISDGAYAAGVRRIKDRVAGVSGGDVRERSEFVKIAITGDKPS